MSAEMDGCVWKANLSEIDPSYSNSLDRNQIQQLASLHFHQNFTNFKNHCNCFIKWSKLEVENLPGKSLLLSFQVSEILNILEVENL